VYLFCESAALYRGGLQECLYDKVNVIMYRIASQ